MGGSRGRTRMNHEHDPRAGRRGLRLGYCSPAPAHTGSTLGLLYCSDQCGASRITRGSSAPHSETCHTSQQAAPHSKIVSQSFKIAKIAKNAPKNRKMFRLRRIRDSPPVLGLGEGVQPSKTLFRGAARGLRPRAAPHLATRHASQPAAPHPFELSRASHVTPRAALV